MSNKENRGKVAVTAAPAPEISLLQARLQKASALQAKVTQLQRIQAHLDWFDVSKIDNEEIENLDPSEQTETKIVLHFGYREKYELKNPSLLAELRSFIVDRLQVRKTEIETDILKTDL